MTNLATWFRLTGLRVLARAPLASAVILIALALGSGSSAAIFSIVSAVLMRPLPISDPELAVIVWMSNPSIGFPRYYMSAPDFRDLRTGTDAFEDIGMYGFGAVTLTGGGVRPEALTAAWVMPGVLQMVGAKTTAGRLFATGEESPGKSNVVIISSGLWRRSFGSDPGVVGRSINLDRVAHTVVGVAAPDFRGPPAFDTGGTLTPLTQDAWIPIGPDHRKTGGEDLTPRTARFFQVIGKLRRGVALSSVGDPVAAVAARLAHDYPESNKNWGMRVARLDEEMTSSVGTALRLLLAAAVGLHLVACVNVANLLVFQARVREGEMALRLALGAGRGRIFRLLCGEGLIYSLWGGAAGIGVASVLLKVATAISPPGIPRIHEATLDAQVLSFAIAAASLSALLFALWPLRLANRASLASGLASTGRGSSRAGWAQDGLVAFQFAVALVLLACSGLLGKSLVGLTSVGPGFQPERATVTAFYLPVTDYPRPENLALFTRTLTDDVSRANGVESCGVMDLSPFSGDEYRRPFEVGGQGRREGAEQPHANYRRVSAGLFRALGVGLRQGRYFTERDSASAKPVVVVNRAFERQHLGGSNPIGRLISFEPPPGRPVWREVVGVVEDIKHFGLADPPFPDAYVPFPQEPAAMFALIVRAKQDSGALGPAIREAIRRLNPDLPAGEMVSMVDLIDRSMSREQFYLRLLAMFAASALVLAFVGVFGVAAHQVARRTREIGIRMALGETPAGVLWSIVSRSLRVAVAGSALGLVAEFTLASRSAHLFVGVSPTDPAILCASVGVLVVAAVLGSYLPARRATEIDPAIAMRAE